MKLPMAEREPSEPRTLLSIDNDFEAYLADGSRKARAEDISHSIIAKPILDIAIDHVSKPSPCYMKTMHNYAYLHLTVHESMVIMYMYIFTCFDCCYKQIFVEIQLFFIYIYFCIIKGCSP